MSYVHLEVMQSVPRGKLLYKIRAQFRIYTWSAVVLWAYQLCAQGKRSWNLLLLARVGCCRVTSSHIRYVCLNGVK